MERVKAVDKLPEARAVRRRRWKQPGRSFLEATCQVRVRFQEVDAMGVVWHGHYATFFDEGREAFGRKYGFGYQEVHQAGYFLPLVHLAIDYRAPARFGDVLTVRCRLHPESAARLIYTYQLQNEAGERLATGQSVQAFTDRNGKLVVTRPAVLEAMLERWAHALQEE